ncbi:phosphonatase-like hydrolase [Saccharopolyspora sp. WRP15-2]|uniref:Phosphonatase-like hydrolase n=1 Tax=Saccharopolyspora oryzae TaxID=2997343 RepID=A0ABT4UX21_9PSEU|nr:phosphonatase-like hydrolase [Saccharopolyspora oryzae]MDA3625689.1 phosphonatase-like hydrolase [Saccharopolyspora oryzae]
MDQLELVVLDMAGTTVRDDGLVVQAFDAALRESGVHRGTAEFAHAQRHIQVTMGQSKIEVFRALFDGDESRAQRANIAFESSYDGLAARRCEPVPGAEEAVRLLRDNGIRTCLSTGFSKPTRERLLDRLKWNDLADLVLCPEESGRGRPFPDMILTAVLRLGISDVRAVAVAGDTAYDMQAGRRSGASVVAGVRTGSHDANALRAGGATHVLASVADLPGLLGI